MKSEVGSVLGLL